MADAKFADIELLHRDTGILGDEEDATDDDEPCIEGHSPSYDCQMNTSN